MTTDTKANHAIDSSFAVNMRTYNPLIASLTENFLQKKQAWTLANRRGSVGSKLDTKRLSQYKTSDELFIRSAKSKEGERHGAIILIDWSGSMGGIAANVIWQAISLATFMRKEKIPHRAYIFIAPGVGQDTCFEDDEFPRAPETNGNDYSGATTIWDASTSINLVNVEIFNSQMTDDEFRKACLYIATIANRNKASAPSSYNPYGYGIGYSMQSTPLLTSLQQLMFVEIPQFRNEENLEKETLFVMTDGEPTDNTMHADHIVFRDSRRNYSMKAHANEDLRKNPCQTSIAIGPHFKEMRLRGTRVVHINLKQDFREKSGWEILKDGSSSKIHYKNIGPGVYDCTNPSLAHYANKSIIAFVDSNSATTNTLFASILVFHNYAREFDRDYLNRMTDEEIKNFTEERNGYRYDYAYNSNRRAEFRQKQKDDINIQKIKDGSSGASVMASVLRSTISKESDHQKKLMAIAEVIIDQLTSEMFP